MDQPSSPQNVLPPIFNTQETQAMFNELRLHQQQFARVNEEMQRLRVIAEQADLRSQQAAIELAQARRPDEPSLRNPTFRPRAPAPFGGGPHELTPVRTWIFNTASYLDSCSFTTEASRMAVIPSLLCGSASTWWMYLALGESPVPVPQNWDDFAAALLRQFEPVNARDQARGLFLVLQQTATVQEYINTWRNLAMQLHDISEEDKRFRFIHGLTEVLQLAINSQPVTSLEETIINAERIDHYQNLRKTSCSSAGRTLQQQQGPGSSTSSNPYTSKIASQPMELGSLEQWDDYSYDERSHLLDEDEYEQIAAIMARPRSLLPRTGRAPFGPGNALSASQRSKALEQNLCYRCLSADHAARDCKMAPPKGLQSSA